MMQLKYKSTSKNKKSKAFSLPEALLVLLIIGICALLVPPLLFRKYEKEEYITHGSWECIMYGGNSVIVERDKKGTVKKQTSVSGDCTFNPPVGAKDYIVDICGYHAELENCNHELGVHVLKYYPYIPKMPGIGIRTSSVDVGNGISVQNDRVYFGNWAFAVYKGGAARVLIVY